MCCGTVSPLKLLLGARRADEALVGGVCDLHPVQRVQVLRDPYFPLVSVADFFRYEQEDPGRARVFFVICLTAGHRVDPVYVEGVGLSQPHVILGPPREFAPLDLARWLEVQLVVIKALLVEVLLSALSVSRLSSKP